LQKGDRLAAVGYAYNCYYARYDRLRIVAQIPDANEFWHLSTPELQRVEERLASIGVTAVVAWNQTGLHFCRRGLERPEDFRFATAWRVAAAPLTCLPFLSHPGERA
jgi:hypothetical protein